MDLHANFSVSLHVASQSFEIISKIEIKVRLKTNTIDWAAPCFELFDVVKYLVRFDLCKARHWSVLIIIVEELDWWVGSACSLEGLTHVVINCGPWTFLNDILWIMTVINGFIDHIPSKCIVAYMLHGLVNIGDHEFLNFRGIRFIDDEVGDVMVSTTIWWAPHEIVCSELLLIIFCNFDI